MMEEPTMSRSRPALATLCAALAALSACGPEHEERRQAEPAATPTPPPTISASPSASIIRPDITPEPVVDLPPPPLMQTVGFPDGGSRLDPAAEQALVNVLESEQIAEDWPIVLGGHSDSAGGDRANLAVSRKRAEAVAKWLREHHVSGDRIEIVAFGEQNPVAPNANPDGTPNEAGRAKNRRVEIRIAPPPEPAAKESDEPEKEASDGA
jgi:OOP family OmpA-OmpF porin